jgi:thioredoxin-like negative regulator of GroEL
MATVNVQDSPQSAGKYSIGPIPATVFLANGMEVGRIEGLISKEELLAEISRRSGQAPAAPAAPGGAPWGWIGGGLAAAGLLAFALTR